MKQATREKIIVKRGGSTYEFQSVSDFLAYERSRNSSDPLRDRVMALLHAPMTIDEVMTRAGLTRKEAAALVGELVRDGKVKRVGGVSGKSTWRVARE